MQQTKLENEEQSQFFKAVIDHVATGIIGFRLNGSIKFTNRAVLDLLGLKQLKSISDLNIVKSGFSDILFKLNPGKQQ